ncbi:hypothetical protein RR48_11735 [Papilio machaon]|uniref:Uncharacterized protein n=1 Tax=Papilio machaon TaxID=76193 RepID=A0A194QMC2_PAPMA|nr:hypothetical protein RR48_11735 [Papilio machaon]
MWKAIINRKRKYSDVLPCDQESSYAALAAMQGGNSSTLPPSLDALRASNNIPNGRACDTVPISPYKCNKPRETGPNGSRESAAAKKNNWSRSETDH